MKRFAFAIIPVMALIALGGCAKQGLNEQDRALLTETHDTAMQAKDSANAAAAAAKAAQDSADKAAAAADKAEADAQAASAKADRMFQAKTNK
jgi:hypothetical protein